MRRGKESEWDNDNKRHTKEGGGRLCLPRRVLLPQFHCPIRRAGQEDVRVERVPLDRIYRHVVRLRRIDLYEIFQ